MNGVNNGATVSLDCGLDAKCQNIGNNIKSLSSTLCGLPPTLGNSVGLKAGTTNEFDFVISVADSFGKAVVNISSSVVFGSSIGTIVVTTTASNLQLLVINVHGDTINLQNNNINVNNAFPNGISQYAGIIWNFCEATTINFQSMVTGAVLAPYASVQFSSNIGGSLACASVVQTAELHMPFLQLPPCLG
jgi:choice-of-anchor A domain-containing protein